MYEIWRRRWPAAAALLAACGALAGLAAAADPPAGIVIAVSGTTDPPLSVMTEVAADAPIKLSAGAKLTLLDYARCKLVTVSSGTVTLGQIDYKVDGHVDSETDGPCAQTYAVGGDTTKTTGGMVMRGGVSTPRWPVNLELLLTGPGAAHVRAAAIYPLGHTDTPVMTLTLDNGRAIEPAGAPPPAPNARYVLRLTTDNAPAPTTTDITFIAVAVGGPQRVVVLRLN